MLTESQKLAARLTEETKKKMLLTKTSRVDIARESGVNRMTVAKYIEHGNDMPMAMFFAAQRLVGSDPVKELKDALDAQAQERS